MAPRERSTGLAVHVDEHEMVVAPDFAGDHAIIRLDPANEGDAYPTMAGGAIRRCCRPGEVWGRSPRPMPSLVVRHGG